MEANLTPGADNTPPEQDTPQAPQVPQVETPTTREEATAFGEMMAEFRGEIAKFREELAQQAQRTQGPRALSVTHTETIEERAAKRLEEIAKHDFYCPGCGKLYKYLRECEGTVEGPHKPIEVVSTSELGGDPANHTAAPSTDPDRPDLPVAA